MYWLSLYLLVISGVSTITRILRLFGTPFYFYGAMLFLLGLYWYFWQEKYGEVSASSEEVLLKFGLIGAGLISCIIALLR
jgi:hypothetical protein